MFAGNDVAHAEPIIRAIKRNLLATAAKQKRPHEAEEVAAIVDDAYSEQLQAQIEKKILLKHGYDSETFQKRAKLQCTLEIYGKTWDRIDREKISLQFLVCGFDKEQVGHIWLVDGENAPTSYNVIDFWAIGSGAQAALSRIALHVSKYESFGTLEEAIYLGITAKFAAESASDVGRSTFVAVCGPPQGRNALGLVSDDAIDRIRTIWNRSGIPPVPQAACKLLSQDITEMNKKIRATVRSKRT